VPQTPWAVKTVSHLMCTPFLTRGEQSGRLTKRGRQSAPAPCAALSIRGSAVCRSSCPPLPCSAERSLSGADLGMICHA
jgi:hypothetical protein